MRVTETVGFCFPEESLEIANSVAAVVDRLIPGEPPFGDRPIEVRLANRRGFGPLVNWDPEFHQAATYQVLLKTRSEWWQENAIQFYHRYARRCRIHPNRPTYSWRALSFQLAHELAHVKMGPARSNLLLEVLATAVSLESLSQLFVRWQRDPPTNWRGWKRYGVNLAGYREGIIRRSFDDLPSSIRRGYAQQSYEDQQTLLHDSRSEVAGRKVTDPVSRAWQMAAADLLTRRAAFRDIRWRDLLGIANHTQPSGLEDRGYREDLPLTSDAIPWWMPEWLR